MSEDVSHYRVVWWRVAVLSLIVVGASYGSWRAFQAAPPASVARPAPASPTAAEPSGPRAGDLSLLLAGAVEFTPAPPPPAERPRTATRARTSSKTKQPKNPFDRVPGAGPLGDLCSVRPGAC